MLNDTPTFSSYSVDNIDKAKTFYEETLGLAVTKVPEGLDIKTGSSADVFIYPKPNHEPATFTVLNFKVGDIKKTVDELTEAGVAFEHYEESEYMKPDEKGIVWSDDMGPHAIAWFTDPAGNVLSVIQEHK